jgi:hypothetical protein
MLYLVHADLSIEELASAITAELEEDELVCRDAAGEAIARYPKLEILVFAHSDGALHVLQAARGEQLKGGGAGSL